MIRKTVLLTLLAAAATAATAAPAAAKTLTVSGRLDHRGYRIVILGYNGSAVIAHGPSFRVQAPDSRFTLQLITPGGLYGGPVIVGYSGKWALEGLTRSVNLGTIVIDVRDGYAHLRRRLPLKFLDSGRRAYTSKGRAPLGNGRNFGFVISPGHAASGAGLDRDQDGVPDLFDIANSGRRILNALAPGGTTFHAHMDLAPSAGAFSWMSQIFLTLDQTLNADAAGVSTSDIDAMLVSDLNLKGLNIPQGDLVELDCTGLSYCGPGGSGLVVTGMGATPANTTTEPFSTFFDSAGYGVLGGPGAAPLMQGPGGGEFSLMPRATSSQIKSGDTPILRITTGGTTVTQPEPIDFVFNTVPALASYSDTAGDSGQISYPASATTPGTQSNPIALHAGSDGHVKLTMTVYPPQRAGIAGAGEPAFMDIGHLYYRIDIPMVPGVQPGNGTSPQCSAASLSTTDPNLTVASIAGPPGQADIGQFVDSSDDRPASSSDSLTMSVDLTQCLADKGVSNLAPGTPLNVELEADAPQASDHANQRVFFTFAG